MDQHHGLRSLHLFAGAGGGILADLLLGHRPVCAVEIESYCQRILKERQEDGIFPFFPIWDDVRTFNGKPWRGLVDLLEGGFPCQRFSTAAHGNNTAADLWPEMLRIARDILPPFVFGENVSKAAIEIAAEDLRDLGYQAIAVELSAKDLGADHIRERYWLLAHTNDESELLFREYAEMASLPRIQESIWKTFSKDTRMDDGVANRMDRFKASGNGQIPCVAALAWKIMIEALATQPPVDLFL